MKFVTLTLTMLLLSLANTSSRAQENKEFDQMFQQSSYQALHVLTAQEGNTIDQDQRELGKLTVADGQEGKHFLRIEFSDIMRMPEVHFESRTEIQDQTDNQSNLEIATQGLENLIVTSPYYKHQFPILGVEKMNNNALEFFTSKFSLLETSNGSKVKLVCQSRQIKLDYFHNVCVDENNNNKQMIEIIASLRHVKYCHMIIRTKLQDFSLLLPLYVPADEYQQKLMDIFVSIEKSHIHDEIELEDVWFALDDQIKEIDPDCALVENWYEEAPNIIFGTIINVEYIDEYYNDQEDANDSQEGQSTDDNQELDNNRKRVKKVRKLNTKTPQTTYTMKKNNFVEGMNANDKQFFKDLRRKRKLTQDRKLPTAEKDEICDLEDIKIQVNYYNLKLFNHVHLRFFSDSEHTAGHVVAKTNYKEAKEQIHTEFEQFVEDLLKVKDIHRKIMATEKDPNQTQEEYSEQDFQNKILEEFPNIKQIKTSHGYIYQQNTNDLIEIKRRGSEYKITFYAPHHDQKHHQKVYMVQTMSNLKDNEHMQFFEKELHKYREWVLNSTKQFQFIQSSFS